MTNAPSDGPPAEPTLLALGRRVLAAQPFSQLLGATLERLTPDEAVLRLQLRRELQQQTGSAHGGVMGYLADNAIAFVAGASLGVDVVTSELKINYLRPAHGRALVAHGVMVHAGRNQATCRCDVYLEDEALGRRLCAVAQGTVARVVRTR